MPTTLVYSVVGMKFASSNNCTTYSISHVVGTENALAQTVPTTRRCFTYLSYDVNIVLHCKKTPTCVVVSEFAHIVCKDFPAAGGAGNRPTSQGEYARRSAL